MISPRLRRVLQFALMFALGCSLAKAQPYVTASYSAVSVELGQTAAISEFASGVQPLTYQWVQVAAQPTNVNNGATGHGSTVSGATAATLIFTGITAADAGNYSLAVTDALGYTVTGPVIALSVKPAAGPMITSQPSNQTLTAGNFATFSVSATGSYPRSYQWFKGTPPSGVAIANATTNPYNYPTGSDVDFGGYYVTVTNAQGSVVSSVFTLTVTAATPPSSASVSPSNAAFYIGGSFTLTANSFGGSAPLTYQWLKNGAPISGATSNSYTVAQATASDAGSYAVTVSNVAGTVTSPATSLTAKAAGAPTITTQPLSPSLPYGGQLNLYVIATGTPSPTYQWYLNGTAIAGATSSGYTVLLVTLANAGTYTVTATNSAGSVTSSDAVVQVAPAIAPVITTQPASAALGAGATLDLTLGLTGSPPLTLVWSFNGTPMPNGTNGHYIISSITAANAGSYTVTVTGPGGSVTSQPAIIIVGPAAPPNYGADTFKSRWQWLTAGQSLRVDSYLSFLNTTYQWYKDGQPLADQTSSVLSKNLATIADSGDYFLAVTSSGGTYCQSSWAVDVLSTTLPNVGSTTPPPWIDVQQQGSILYFLIASPAEVLRFDLNSGTWLPPVPLPSLPTALAAAPEGIYISFGLSAALYALDLSQSAPLPNTSQVTFAIFYNSKYVYLAGRNDNQQAVFTAINRTTRALVKSSAGSIYTSIAAVNYAVSPDTNQVFFCATGSSPSSTEVGSLSADGSVSGGTSNLHSLNPATRTYVVGSRVIDSGGTVYSTASLPTGSLGLPFDDLCVTTSNHFAVVRGGRVALYEPSRFARLGQIQLASPILRLFSSGNTVYGFSKGASGSIGVSSLSEDQLLAASPAPLPAVSPVGLAFVPQSSVMDATGNVYLLSKLYSNVFVWSPTQRKWLATLPLSGSPNGMSYSGSLNRLYFYYGDNRITKIDLGSSFPQETAFSTSPLPILSITAADSQLLVHVADAQDSGDALITFSSDGALEVLSASGYNATAFYWDTPQQRAVGGNFSTLASFAISNAGALTSPLNVTNGVQKGALFRFSGDGTQIVDNTGVIYSATSLAPIATLGTAFKDAAWVGANIFALSSSGYASTVQIRGGTGYVTAHTTDVLGYPLANWPLASQMLALTIYGTGPIFTVIDQTGAVVSEDVDPGTAAAPGGVPVIAQQPAAQSVPSGSSSGFGVMITSPTPVSYQWELNGRVIAGATSSTYAIPVATQATAGNYTVLVSNSSGVATSNPAALIVDSYPVIPTSPTLGSFTNSGASLSVTAVSNTPLSYQWQLNGAAISGATGATLTLTSAQLAAGGSYTVVVNNGTASVTSGAISVTGHGTRLVNLSALAQVGTGSNALVVGFVVAEGPKQVLIRGIGPTLGLVPFNLPGVLPDSFLTLYDAGGNIQTTGTGWGGGAVLSQAFAQVGAFPLPSNSADAAFLATAAGGNATASLRSSTSYTGTGLLEFYDTTGISASRLVNISARANVSSGHPLVAGFVVDGTGSETVLIRAVGPTLAAAPFNLSGVLAQPVLTLYDGHGAVIATNSNWGDTPGLAAVFSSLGAFGLLTGSADAAWMITLPAGNYTAQVTSANGTSGIALMEVYEAN